MNIFVSAPVLPKRLVSLMLLGVLLVPTATFGADPEELLPEGVIDIASTTTLTMGEITVPTSTVPDLEVPVVAIPDPSELLAMIPFFATSTYKHSFGATLTGGQVVPPADSTATGHAVFNVGMGETFIDFAVNMNTNARVTDVILGCAPAGDQNDITVVSLLDVPGITTMDNDPIVRGVLFENDILEEAVTCEDGPEIETLPHLIQSMREGMIYVLVLTEGYIDGEIRGQLGLIDSPVLPPVDDNGNGNGTSTSTTTTPGTDTGTSTATSTATTTDETMDDDDDDGGSSSSGGRSRSRSRDNDSDGRVLGASSENRCNMLLTSYIKPGAMNNPLDVKILQLFLNVFYDADLTVTGIYDANTIRAVNEFQVEEYQTVLRPWVPYGLPTEKTPTGYVYKTTKWTIDSLVCGDHVPRPILP